MSDPIKLSDERVREILAWSVHPTGRGLVHLMPTDAEVAAMVAMAEAIRARAE